MTKFRSIPKEVEAVPLGGGFWRVFEANGRTVHELDRGDGRAPLGYEPVEEPAVLCKMCRGPIAPENDPKAGCSTSFCMTLLIPTRLTE